jgi:hypothetical protein
MKMKSSIIHGLMVICLLSACKKDNCTVTMITEKHLESEYGCVNTKRTLSIDLNNECIIIRSKTDYDNKVSGSCHPEIDFSLYDLVIGKQASGNENDTIKYDLRRTCPKEELTLTVDIIQSAATRPDNVIYHALIPKLGDEEALNVIVNVK